MLATFTEQGIKNVKQTVERADAFRQMAAKAGATVKDMYWTLGSRDIVAIFDAPDDETATALALSVAISSNVRSETLRAFSLADMQKIVGKLVSYTFSLLIRLVVRESLNRRADLSFRLSLTAIPGYAWSTVGGREHSHGD